MRPGRVVRWLGHVAVSRHPVRLVSARLRGPNRDFARSQLLARLPKGGRVAEVGVWKGDFSAQILAACEPEELHLIDPWGFAADEERDEAIYGAGAGDQTELDRVYEAVKERFAAEPNVHLHRTTGVAAARLFERGFFDWVYVDADHRYEPTLETVRAFLPLIKPGGRIAGDDYGTVGWWNGGVTRAIDDLEASGDLRPELFLGNQFLLRRG